MGVRRFLRRRSPGRLAPDPVAAAAPTFATWDEALAQCSSGAYEGEKLVALVRAKTEAWREQLLRGPVHLTPGDLQTVAAVGTAAAARAATSEPLAVLDYGGACGAHYFLVRTLYPELPLDWRVVETPAMVRRARDLETDGLRFFGAIDSALRGLPHTDLVHASGTLQFVPRPHAVLAALLRQAPRHVLVARLGVVARGSDRLAVHRHALSANGPGPAPPGFEDEEWACPVHYLSRGPIEEALTAAHDIVFTQETPAERMHVGEFVIDSRAWFCRRRRPAGTPGSRPCP